jgi:hypothetical protein
MKNGKTGRTKGNEFPWPGVCASLTGEGMDGILVKKKFHWRSALSIRVFLL